MTKLFIMPFFIFFIFFQPLFAGEIGVQTFPLTATSSVHIVNRANQSLTFAIRPQNGIWGNYTIASGKSITISCKECITKFFEFDMKTNKSAVFYSLPAGERYVLEWNKDKGLWDIFTAMN